MTNGKAFDASSWEFTQKQVRLGHNRKVKKHFRDIQSDSDYNNGRTALKTCLIIRDADSASECLVKMHYFANYLAQNNIATLPDGWQIKKGQNIPQLAIIYRNSDKDSISGNYVLHIPHYNGIKTPNLSAYKREATGLDGFLLIIRT
ncbi:MAG: hypothetical protein HC930_01255 [Hydrococcus sp. SU_1_0]|nr:hypothetical protein [Hydrococcus sp. SU_1_0]